MDGLGGNTMEMEGHKEHGVGGMEDWGGAGFLKYLIILCVFCEFDLALFWPLLLMFGWLAICDCAVVCSFDCREIGCW